MIKQEMQRSVDPDFGGPFLFPLIPVACTVHNKSSSIYLGDRLKRRFQQCIGRSPFKFENCSQILLLVYFDPKCVIHISTTISFEGSCAAFGHKQSTKLSSREEHQKQSIEQAKRKGRKGTC